MLYLDFGKRFHCLPYFGSGAIRKGFAWKPCRAAGNAEILDHGLDCRDGVAVAAHDAHEPVAIVLDFKRLLDVAGFVCLDKLEEDGGGNIVGRADAAGDAEGQSGDEGFPSR